MLCRREEDLEIEVILQDVFSKIIINISIAETKIGFGKLLSYYLKQSLTMLVFA